MFSTRIRLPLYLMHALAHAEAENLVLLDGVTSIGRFSINLNLVNIGKTEFYNLNRIVFFIELKMPLETWQMSCSQWGLI